MPAEMLGGLTILIVEDEVLLRKQIAARLQALGAEVSLADTLAAARKSIGATNFDLALLDVNLPDGRGTDLLQEKLFPMSTGVVVMTATGAVTGAVEAMRLGAVDYLVKPFDPAELPLVLERARRARQAARIEEHRRDLSGLFFGEALAGLEAQLEKILVADRRVQGALAPILIQGETGTGKTTIARWIHQRGPRANYCAGTLCRAAHNQQMATTARSLARRGDGVRAIAAVVELRRERIQRIVRHERTRKQRERRPASRKRR